jgi:hypothetical protein
MTDWTAAGDVLAARCVATAIIYPPGQPIQGLAVGALLDTGAMRSAISQPLAQHLTLPVIGQRMVATPVRGLIVCETYSATIEVLKPGLDGAGWPFQGHQLDQLISPMGALHLLLGMDIIGQGSLEVGGGVWRLTFPALTARS